MEHRWGTRRSINLGVLLVGHPGGRAPGWLKDLSLSGAFVRTHLVLPVMTTVRVVPPGRTKSELLAYVVRVEAAGMGLEWWDISPECLRRLSPETAPTLHARRPASAVAYR